MESAVPTSGSASERVRCRADIRRGTYRCHLPRGWLAGEAPDGLWAALAAQVGQAGLHGRSVRTASPANGSYSPETRTVTVRPDLSDAQACKNPRFMSWLHVLMEHEFTATRGLAARFCEVEAEEVAYVVMRSQGLLGDRWLLAPRTWRPGLETPRPSRRTAARVVKVRHADHDRRSNNTILPLWCQRDLPPEDYAAARRFDPPACLDMLPITKHHHPYAAPGTAVVADGHPRTLRCLDKGPPPPRLPTR